MGAPLCLSVFRRRERSSREIRWLVQSALHGYKVYNFAYGQQTTSGKLHTMRGIPDACGMILRALVKVFRSAVDLRDQGWTLEVKGGRP